MHTFFSKHPFIATVFKLVTVIVVSFTTFIGCILSVLIVFIIIVALLSLPSSDNGDYIYGNKDSNNKLISIPIKGTIMGEQNEDSVGGFLGGQDMVYGYQVKHQIEEAIKDTSIKGIILEVDSPGGTIFGARAIVDGVEKYKKETGNPVIAHVSGLAASGAYWTVTSADKIIADYGSLVGSIGVIFGPFQYYDKVLSEDGGLFGGGVTTQNGIDSFYFTAGKYKDFGNPYRRFSAEESKNAQELVDSEYVDFVARVSLSRGISADVIRNTIGAQVYDNKRAFSLKLIDGTGGRDETFLRLARLAKLKDDDYQVVKVKQEYSGLSGLLGAYLPARQSPKVLSICSNRTLLSFYGDVQKICN